MIKGRLSRPFILAYVNQLTLYREIAYEAMELLVSQMNERKKRKPTPQTEIIHKMITPVLVRRDTTT